MKTSNAKIASINTTDMDNEKAVNCSSKQNSPFKKMLQDYMQSTTMHGLRYAFSERNHLSKRLLWLLVILSLISGFSVTFIASVIEYYKRETFINTQILTKESIALPSITICSVNIGMETKINKVSTDYLFYLQTLSGSMGGLKVPNQHIPEITKTIKFKDFYKMFGPDINDIFVSCSVAYQEVDCHKYITEVTTTKGNCFTFNSAEYISKHGDIKVVNPGPSYGIALTLDVNPEEYGHPVRLGEGFALLVQDPSVHPLVDAKSRYISAGKEYFYGMQKHEMVFMAHPYNEVDCITPENYENEKAKQNMNSSLPYSHESCINNCFIMYFSNHCNCQRNSDGNDTCTMWIVSQCLESAQVNFYRSGEDCGCLLTCKRVNYEAKVSSLAFPNNLMSAYAKQLNWPVQNITLMKQRYLQIHIYYDTMEEVLTQQQPVIGLPQLLSNFGGQMGLYMGASVVTVLEIIDLLVNVIKYFCCTQSTKKTGVASIAIKNDIKN